MICNKGVRSKKLSDKNTLGMMVVGIFGKKDELEGFLQYDGLLHGGGFYLLGVQIFACVCFMIWAGTITFTLIYVSTLLLFFYCRMVTFIYFIKLLYYLSRSAHRTPNFMNPELQFPQFKVLQVSFFFNITSYIGISQWTL